MHFKISSPLFVAVSASVLTSGAAFAQDVSLNPTDPISASIMTDGTSVRADSKFEDQRDASHSIRKLVKKMLTQRTTRDICDKGTGQCK